MADILEVLYAIMDSFGWTTDDIEKLRLEKKEKNGGFDLGHILTLPQK